MHKKLTAGGVGVGESSFKSCESGIRQDCSQFVWMLIVQYVFYKRLGIHKRQVEDTHSKAYFGALTLRKHWNRKVYAY